MPAAEVETQQGPPAGGTATAAAEAWVEAFTEGWRAPAGADAFVDHFEPWMHPEIRLVQPQLPTIVGLEAFRERFARPLFELIPDLHGTVEGWAARGDVIYIELRLHGTLGGRPVSWLTVDRVTLREGRAVERVASFDPTPVLRALALAPRAWPRFLAQQLRNLTARWSS